MESIIPPWLLLLTTTFTVVFILRPKSTTQATLLGPLICLIGGAQYIALRDRQRQVVPAFYDQWSVGCACGAWIISSLDYLVISDPRREFLRDGEKIPLADRKDASLWYKLKWVFGILTTARGLGWSWKAKNVPAGAPKGYPKWRFVSEQVTRSAVAFIVESALIAYGRSLRQGKDPLSWPLAEEPLYQQVICGWFIGCRIWASFCKTFHGAAAFFVATGINEPYQWPPLFGDLTKIYSLRQFWGAGWHQNCRRMTSVYGSFVCRKLGLQKGSFASRYTQLFIGFWVSAFIHAYSAYHLTGNSDAGCWQFFMLQAVAILVEDHVIDAAKAAGVDPDSTLSHLVGRLWIFCWFSYSTAMMARKMAPHGMYIH